MTKIDKENKDKTNKSEIVEEQKPTEESTAKRRKGVLSVRLKKLEANLAEVEKERDEFKNFLLRKAAEFDNFKKRTENEQIQLIANANADLITELLPVLDDLERSLNAADKNKKFEVLLAGVQLIFKNFTKILEKRGVEPIPSKGVPFDPEKHDALLQIENTGFPSGTVVDQHLRGYTLNGRVLRHSQVLVSK